MDAQAVLSTVRSGNAPSNWFVWPLRRDYVMREAIKWVFASLFGFVLFIPACLTTLPTLSQRSFLGITVTSVLLLLLGSVAFGGAALAIFDFYRLRHADDYWLVLTPDEFIKAEPRKVIYVPLEYVGDITVRGVKTPEEERESLAKPTRSYLLRASYTRKPQSPPSLAFRDLRTDKTVVVSTDQSFENLVLLEQILGDTVHAKQRRRTG